MTFTNNNNKREKFTVGDLYFPIASPTSVYVFLKSSQKGDFSFKSFQIAQVGKKGSKVLIFSDFYSL